MTSDDFCFWLRGFYELNGETALTAEQSLIISQHLTLVFEQKAKELPPVSTWKPFSLEDVTVDSAISKVDDLTKAFKDMKKWVSKDTPWQPTNVTVSCREYSPTAKIC